MTDFGDRVRIKQSPETASAGLVGLEGDVYGFTTPSVTNVEVVGGAPDDYALNVSIEERGSTFWLRPDFVEFLHHNAGMEMKVGNIKAVRQPDGSWSESEVRPASSGMWTWLKQLFKS